MSEPCDSLFAAKDANLAARPALEDTRDATAAAAIASAALAEAADITLMGHDNERMDIELQLETYNCYQQALGPSGESEQGRFAMEAKHRMRKLKWAYIGELLNELFPPKPSVEEKVEHAAS